MNPDKLSVIFLNLFIISFPLSVTVSQGFAILSFISFLVNAFFMRKLLVTLKNKFFLGGIFLYLALLSSLFVHFFQYENSIIKILTRSEVSDFWMCFLILPSYYHIRNPKYKKWIIRSFFLSAFLVLVSGLVTIFTPFRLASYITSGFKVEEGARLQHFAGDFWGRYTFLPIGLMNTHLTFGGLCGLFFPGLTAYWVLTIRKRSILKNTLSVIGLFLFALVVFYNQSRSIWLGIAFTSLLIFIKLISSFNLNFFKLKYLFFFILLVAIISGVSLKIYKKNWLLQRAFQESLADNTTENQRYFIYKNTFEILKKHWLLGVGPGRFDNSHQDESNEMIKKNEQLWYELFITPRQHAHNDLLHFFSLGGILALIAFLYFWFTLFRIFIRNPLTPESILFSGILVIFIAGFFQCYLLDDEVALPFFAMVGLFIGSISHEEKLFFSELRKIRRKENRNESFYVEQIPIGNSFLYFLKRIFAFSIKLRLDKDILFSLYILIIPITINLFYIFYKTRLEPMQVYKRKVSALNLEERKSIFQSLKGASSVFPTYNKSNSKPVRIEGCLSHRFTDPISIRKSPFQIKLKFTDYANNPPKFAHIQVIERDSFDQDRLYKVHGLKQIGGEYLFEISKFSPTIIDISDPAIYTNLLKSKQFPENIYFRDFQISFSGFDSSKAYFDLPAIDFGELCDAK